MHQQDDSEFVASLKRFRIGKAIDAYVNLINSRQIDFLATPSTSEFKPILLTLNLHCQWKLLQCNSMHASLGSPFNIVSL
jgi:hypothetical protein